MLDFDTPSLDLADLPAPLRDFFVGAGDLPAEPIDFFDDRTVFVRLGACGLAIERARIVARIMAPGKVTDSCGIARNGRFWELAGINCSF